MQETLVAEEVPGLALIFQMKCLVERRIWDLTNLCEEGEVQVFIHEQIAYQTSSKIRENGSRDAGKIWY
jgi:hypothetical protein